MLYDSSVLIFLSTLSLRRATVNGGGLLSCFGNFYPRSPCGERLRHNKEKPRQTNFYPRSPCGERLHYDNYNLHCVEISIHALLAESDLAVSALLQAIPLFLSTLSLRRATWPFRPCCKLFPYFYPRSPCGERPTDMSKRLIEF